VLAPWASVHPFEFWILPKKHRSTFLDISAEEIGKLAETMRVCFGGLHSLLKDPPYNFGFHLAPNKIAEDYYHWHLEVYPKLSIWAGLEKSFGVFVNTMPPEDAANSLRREVQVEKAKLDC
jgi:UDPglucose--hexose-1-phosphate uridylyltransferase